MAKVILNEAEVAAGDTLGLRGQGVSADVDLLSGLRVNNGALPGGALGVLDVEVVGRGVRGFELDGAADTGAAVGALVAVRVVGGGAVLEGGESGVDDGGAVLGVLAGLQASVADVLDAHEGELLGEIVARLVLGVGHVQGEDDVLEAVFGGVFHAPAPADQGGGEGEEAGAGGEGGEGLHVVERVVWF